MVRALGAAALLVFVGAGSAGLVASLARGSSSPSLPAAPGSMDYFLKIDGLQGLLAPPLSGVPALTFACGSGSIYMEFPRSHRDNSKR